MSVKKFVDDSIAQHKVMMFSKSYCPYCKMAKAALKEANVDFFTIEIEDRPDCQEIQNYLQELTKARSVPRVFINGKCIGGGTETQNLKNSGKLAEMVR